MIVQIIGVGFVNKGAELMLYAVVQQMKILFPEVVVSVDLRCGSYRQRKQAGLYHLAWLHSRRFPFFATFINFLAGLMPKWLRNFLKIVRLIEVDIVLDASGFVYSDQQDIVHAKRMKNYSRLMKQMGKKVVLLPQAFGPFEKKTVRDAVCVILENSDLVFARDTASLGYLLDLPVDARNIKRSPDFTCLVSGTPPDYFRREGKRSCVVPNYRMIDRTSSDVGKNYPNFLMRCINYLIKQDLDPFILIHEENDVVLLEDIQKRLMKPIDIIQESNHLYLKGILGSCALVISSRYHGLVSSLSQGVPSLATGWSHKYQTLLDDYECPECLLSVSASDEEIGSKIDMVYKKDTRAELIARLRKNSLGQRELVLAMWEEVRDVGIGLSS